MYAQRVREIPHTADKILAGVLERRPARPGSIDPGVRERPGVNLDGIETRGRRALRLGRFGRDKRACHDSRRFEGSEKRSPVFDSPGHRKPALGRHLLTTLWNERHLIHPFTKRDRPHLGRARHFQIELHVARATHVFDVAVDDVPTILPQVNRDAVGAPANCGCRGGHHIRLAVALAPSRPAAVPGLTDGRDMIDINSEQWHRTIVSRDWRRNRVSSAVRILLATLGSAGDTHPYIAIGEELVRRGHSVAMLANPHFEARVRSCGIQFLPLGEEKDFLDVLHDPRLAQQGKSPYLVIQALFNKTVEPSYRAMQDAVARFRPDAIVRHHILFAASWVAEQHGIPFVTGVLTPSMWFHPDEPTILRSYLPRSLQRAMAGPIRVGGRFALRWFIDRPVNRVRAGLGLPPIRDVFFRESKAGARVLGLWSRHFRPGMPGDPARSEVTGFCFFDRAGGEADRALGPDLDRFLDRWAGRAPVIFTLGTTIVHHAGDMFGVAVRAAREIERPIVLLTGGQRGLDEFRGASDVCVCDYAPHSLLMPRGAASIHHAGAGSAAQALRSGRPSVSVPFVNDEFDIAHRMQQLGVSAYVPASRLRSRRAVRNFAEALRQVTEAPSLLERATVLGNSIRSESGAVSAAKVIESAGFGSMPNP